MIRIPVLVGIAGFLSYFLYNNEKKRIKPNRVEPEPVGMPSSQPSYFGSPSEEPLSQFPDDASESSVDLEDLRL